MLNNQLRHHLPGFHGSSVGIVGAIDLQHAAIGDNRLAFTGIYETAQHIDIAIKYVILRILVDTGDTFFMKHNSDIRSGHA